MSIEIAIRALEQQLEPIERLLRLFTASLDKPTLTAMEGGGNGFRYAKPDIRHFCLLKAVRALSTMHASLELARKGYVQETSTLIRTIVECTNHIEFVVDIDESEEHKKAVKRYIESFFADWERAPEMAVRRAHINQGAVHTQLGKTLDAIAASQGETDGRVPGRQRYSNIYRVFSNYVHANYPECMDLYGGLPGWFHLHGFDGTPKLGEGLEMLQSYVVTVTNTIVLMVQRLQLKKFVESDPVVDAWWRNFFKRSG